MKLALKEDIIPKAADKVVFLLAPVIAVIPAFVACSVIPFGPMVTVPFTDTSTPLQLTDMPVAVLFVMAIASIGIYGIVLGGWSQRLDVLPARRAALERPDDLLRGRDGPRARRGVPLRRLDVDLARSSPPRTSSGSALILVPSFVIYVIAMVGETNRAPFDLPEAEGELVGGFHTEYSSLKFALFFLAEYINMATVSALATTLFLGGWHAPWRDRPHLGGREQGYWPLLWFFGKVLFFIFIFIWLRGSLPRLRYDQFMALRLEAADPDLAAVDRRRRHDPRDLLSGGIDRAVPADRASACSPCCSWCCSSSANGATRTSRRRGRLAAARRRLPGAADARRRRRARRRPPLARRRDRVPDAPPSAAGGDLMADPEGTVLGPGRRVRGHVPDHVPKVVTEQYPFEKLPTAPRFHGRHQLNRWPDGLEKCIGCELCAWACPADAIYVEGASNTERRARFSPG